MSDTKKTLIDKLLDAKEEIIKAAKKPYIKKKVKRQFESALDSLDEQVTDMDMKITELHGEMIESPDKSNDYIRQIAQLKLDIEDAEDMKRVIEAEFKKLFG